MLRTEALAKGFTLHLRGGVRIPVLSDVGLTVHAGECVVLSGPSGAGKSTLMRSLYGNYRADGGRILVRHRGDMVDIATADPRTILAVRQETLGYVSQFLRVVPRVAGAGRGGRGADRARRHGRSMPARSARADLLLRLNIPRRLHAIAAGHLLRRRATAREPGARLHRRTIRCCCSTNRPPRWTPRIVRSWWR